MGEKPNKFNLLELLSRAKDYEITQCGDTSFEINDYKNSLGAKVNNECITYYNIVDCSYNSCEDLWVEIDMNALNKLKAFCECITREIEYFIKNE